MKKNLFMAIDCLDFMCYIFGKFNIYVYANFYLHVLHLADCLCL